MTVPKEQTESPNPPALFHPGDLVQRLNQPESTGVVRENRWNSQVERWDYIVQFGSQRIGVPEALLQPLVSITSPWQALEEQQLSGRIHFISSLTYERLLHPPARIANSFATAKTRFYPYQFKPLLKFLDHPGKRLLIADDVGLGKTIEAGYILRELDAHKKAERILVLVPARLATKWKRELETRFNETFEKVKGRDLLQQAERMSKGQDPDSFRWIVSYESVRSEDIRKALEATQLPLDILIGDEAHRMRNPESLQHKIGAVLSACADATIFLTATPVMNRLEDLWQLLRLLSPEEFAIWEVFRDRIESNRFILSTQRALSIQPPQLQEARRLIQQFSAYLKKSGQPSGEFLSSVQERLIAGPKSRRELIELQADVGRLSPIGHLVSRTRKADAMIDHPERVAHWQHVQLSEVEREIYESVEMLCREAGMGGATPWGFEMSLLMAYRAMASCIPAAIDYFASKLQTTATIDMDDFEEEEAMDEVRLTAWTGSVRKRFMEIVEIYRTAEPEDSKLQLLLDILQEIWDDDDRNSRSRRKIVVFSFFRGTLNYLARRLSSKGISNRMIHGGVPLAEREKAIDEFLRRRDTPVLLTSEVGGEGIDLIQASVVVNYDLPWNPMVVEQRIGRIDRIGQEAKRIIVHNLVVRGSVEERVLSRLLSKIAVFLQTIGDLEPIVGEQIEKLTAQALRGELSEEEIERRIEQQASVLDRTRLDALEVLSQADSLLAADQALVDEIEALTGERQVPSEEELLLFLNRVLEEFYPGRQLPTGASHDVVTVDLSGDLALDLELSSIELGADAAIFGRNLSKGAVEITLSREAAYRRTRAELVHLQHPLSKFALWKLKQKDDQNRSAFQLSIRTSVLAPGEYVFLIASVDIHAQRPVTRLACLITSFATQQLWVDPEVTTAVLVSMLRSGEDIHINVPPPDQLVKAKERLLSGLQQLLAEWETRENKLDGARQERQRSSQLSVLQFRRKRAEERVHHLRQGSAAEFPIRMAEAKLAIAKREENDFIKSPRRTNWGGVSHREVAVGILSVEPEQADA